MNKVILMGRVAKEFELKYTAVNNTAICSFPIAVNRRFVRQGEEKQTDFINVVAFGKTAEFCNNYFTKGKQVAIIGRIQTRSWEDKDGQKKYATEVIAEETYFADSKTSSGNNTSKTIETVETADETFTDDEELPF